MFLLGNTYKNYQLICMTLANVGYLVQKISQKKKKNVSYLRAPKKKPITIHLLES